MSRYWRDAADGEVSDGWVSDVFTSHSVVLVEGLLVEGSREQAVERMLDAELSRYPAGLSEETQAERREFWRPTMARLLAAAEGRE